jgi:hypothetical protein
MTRLQQKACKCNVSRLGPDRLDPAQELAVWAHGSDPAGRSRKPAFPACREA